MSKRQRRIYLSIEANYFGYGGVTKVSKLSGVSRVVITKGKKELEENIELSVESSREKGGGRKKTIDKYPEIEEELKNIIEPHARGEPEVCTSMDKQKPTENIFRVKIQRLLSQLQSCWRNIEI